MERYGRIPLLFFFIAASLGLALRWQLIAPVSFIQYSYLLHAHSHIMFLGWIFNALYFAFVYSFFKVKWNSRYRTMFIILQLLVVAMLISFPLQGYGFFSILFSTLHTAVAIVFIIRFLRDVREVSNSNRVSCYAVKISLIFFLLSTLGPFTLGYLMSSGLGHSKWYSFSVYYYLHFQYNGFFLLGILGLFFKILEDRSIAFSIPLAEKGIRWTAFACLPAYFLSTLWASPGQIFTMIGFVGGILQLLALFWLIKSCSANPRQIKNIFTSASVILLWIVLILVLLKETLQLISAHPLVAQLAYEFRTYVMAYLHLVLVGIVSLFIIVWYIEQRLVKLSQARIFILLFVTGFLGMEFLLIASPSLLAENFSPVLVQKGIFIFSTILWLSSGGLFFVSFIKNKV